MLFNLDIYSTPVNYSYHKYYLYPSICGGIVSLILYLLLLAYFIYLLYDMAKGENPFVYITKYYNDFPSSLEILYDDFDDELKNDKSEEKVVWYFSIQIDSKKETSDNYLDFDFYQYHYDLNETFNDTITYHKCSKKKPYYPDNNYTNYLCLNEQSFTLKGTYGFKNSSWLEIHIRKKKEPDTSFFENLKINFFYENHIFNITKFRKDITPITLDEVFWELLPNYTKISELTLSLDTIGTIDTFLPTYLNNYKKNKTINPKKWTDQIKNLEDNILLKIRIYLDRHSTKTERKFEDVITIFALIGGLIGLIIPLGTILVFCIRDFRMTESMMNDSYYIIDPEETSEIPTFDEFLKNHLNKLLELYQNPKKKHKKNKISPNLIKNEEEKELMDNEGISKHSFNPLENFFTLKRIENLFRKQRNELSTNNIKNLKNDENIEYDIDYSNIDQKKYIIYKLIYDCAKFKSQPDFKFSLIELIFFYVFDCCKSKKRKIIEEIDLNGKEVRRGRNNIYIKNFNLKTLKEEDIKINKVDIKEGIYQGALKRLGIDFDLINILKTEEGFENFEKMILEKHERIIFNLESKPIIKLSENEENIEEEYDDDKEKKELKDLYVLNNVLHELMNNKKELKNYQIRLLHSIGRSLKDIQLFQNVKNGKDISKEIDEIRKNKDREKNNIFNLTNETAGSARDTESVLLSSMNNSETERNKDEKIKENNSSDEDF